MAENYGKKLHFLYQSLEKQLLKMSILFRYCFFIVSTSGFTNFKHPNKKKNWQTINCTDVSAAENQRRVDSQLKLWWWCSLRIDQGVYHLLNASILWGTLSGVWIKEKVSKKCVEQPPKKNVTGILVASCGCFLQISYVFLRTLFVCHQKNKTTLMIDAFPKKNTTFLWGGEAFSCLPHHQHRDSSAFF